MSTGMQISHLTRRKYEPGGGQRGMVGRTDAHMDGHSTSPVRKATATVETMENGICTKARILKVGRSQRRQHDTLNSHLPLHQLTNQPTSRPTDQPINPSISQLTIHSINQAADQPINQPAIQSINESINQSTDQPTNKAIS